jgi:hypothetical protein
MPDKIDLGFLGFVIVEALLVVVMYDFTSLSSAQQTDFWATIIGYAFLDAPQIFIFLFPAYWAFDIRRALAVRVYRNQALGIGLVSLAFLFLGIFISTSFSYNLSLIVIFYWLDASILAARRSDPLLRDTLRWSKLRSVVWAMNLIAIGVGAFFVVSKGDISYMPSDAIWGNVVVLPDFAIPILALVFLPLVARRSGDSTLRRHIEWFGVFAVLQFVAILGGATIIGGASYFVGFAFGGYCLFRSARSLAPINRLARQGTTELV